MAPGKRIIAPLSPAARSSRRESKGTAPQARIALVDDHAMIRSGLAHLINAQPDMTVVFDVGEADSVFEHLALERPQLLVTDLAMPRGNGIELVKKVKAQFPEVPVLVLSMHDEAVFAERVLRAGADGYIMKSLGADHFLHAIRRVLSGEKFLSDPVWAQLAGGINSRGRRHHNSPIPPLTDREFEVLELIGKGRNTREIADDLKISPKTVDVHRVRLRKKLGLRDATALLRYALRWAESEALSS
jgi:DNA-binding NarL/FixJ family response regulator